MRGRLRDLAARGLVGALAVACTTLLLTKELTWRVDTWIYDLLLSRIGQTVDERILVVEIDERSLAGVGRWPWSRGTHADLLDRLREAGAERVILNAVFAEPDRLDPAGDARLAATIAAAGNVVLPVMAEPAEPGGMTIEVLPMPALAAAAAGLGHVEADTDLDGVARHADLLAGLGSPHWPALALALLRLEPAVEAADDARLPGRTAPEDLEVSPYQWARDRRILVPYAEPGAFPRLSYLDVLEGAVDPALLRGRWVLVGTTAAGVDHGLLTPRSRGGGALPSIEYHANVLNALARGEAIVPMAPGRQWALSMLLALLPLLFFGGHSSARRGWLAGAAAALVTLACCALLLYAGRTWFAPTPALAVLAAGALAWTLTRLRLSQQLAHSDALTRLANRRMFDLVLSREIRSARRSGLPLSLLALDVDHFKHYNDRYGHRAGDEVLRQVAITIGAHARRPRDLAARYGGDELMVILPETDPAMAAAIADAIVRDVRALAIAHAESDVAPWITVTAGAAVFAPGRDAGAAELIERADAALYRAKRDGRDRCHLDADGPSRAEPCAVTG